MHLFFSTVKNFFLWNHYLIGNVIRVWDEKWRELAIASFEMVSSFLKKNKTTIRKSLLCNKKVTPKKIEACRSIHAYFSFWNEKKSLYPAGEGSLKWDIEKEGIFFLNKMMEISWSLLYINSFNFFFHFVLCIIFYCKADLIDIN